MTEHSQSLHPAPLVLLGKKQWRRRLVKETVNYEREKEKAKEKEKEKEIGANEG